MTTRRGIYKEYIQILPAAASGPLAPTLSSAAVPTGATRIILPPTSPSAAPPAEPPAPQICTDRAAKKPEAAATSPVAGGLTDDPLGAEVRSWAIAPRQNRRMPAPTDGRIALIAATLALAVSTATLTWTVTRPQAETDGTGLSTQDPALAGLKTRLTALESTLGVVGQRAPDTGTRVDRVESGQAGVLPQSADLETATATTASIAAEVTGSIGLRPAGEPLRQIETVAPTSVAADGWVLRDVARGLALVEGRRGYFEVAVGTPLPGLGRVQAIERRDGRMVVVTQRGVILPPSGD